MKKLVLVGGGGHAKVLAGELMRLGEYGLLGYTALHDAGPLLGLPFLGGDEILAGIIRSHPGCAAALGIGTVNTSEFRKAVFLSLRDQGFEFPAIISPHAVVGEETALGDATVVFAGAVVNPGVRFGRGVIVNTNASVDHDGQIGDFVHIAPGATLSGGVSVGDFSFIGTGASLIQGVRIGSKCLIGAGAVVTKDCLEAGTYVGVPARRKG
ncbi:MAG TPA: hexapeptide transferase [Deltaproteobacteria bacterium]|nr:hexapeptide transferase [Deltaproteobacteria bacterium]